MGAFSGLITFGIAFWFLTTASEYNKNVSEEQKENGWKWFWIGAGVYFGGYILGMTLNWLFVAGEIDVPIGDASMGGMAAGGDSGFLGIVLELSPIVIGLVAAYAVRAKYLLKEALPIPEFITNLLSKKK